jgi:hypothetical protein
MAVGGGGANGSPLPFGRQSRCSSGGSSVPHVSQSSCTLAPAIGSPCRGHQQGNHCDRNRWKKFGAWDGREPHRDRFSLLKSTRP